MDINILYGILLTVVLGLVIEFFQSLNRFQRWKECRLQIEISK